MIPKAMDRLDLVEAVMLIEEVFGTEIPDNDAENFGSPQEMAEWLELHLSNQRPNKQAAVLLGKLPKAQTTLNGLTAWKAHGDENKLPLSSAKSFASRGFECKGLWLMS